MARELGPQPCWSWSRPRAGAAAVLVLVLAATGAHGTRVPHHLGSGALALRGGGGGAGDAGAELRRVQQETWRELRDQGYIAVGADADKHEEESEGAHGGVPLTPIARPAAAPDPALAADVEGISARLAQVLRSPLRGERGTDAAGGAAAAQAPIEAEAPTAAAQAGAAPPAPAGAAAAPAQAVADDEPAGGGRPSPPGPPGHRDLGGRSQAQVLSWDDEAPQQTASASALAAPSWRARQGDVTVPGDEATLAAALSAARGAPARILLHGGRHVLGEDALEVVGGGEAGAGGEEISPRIRI
jgi:hypothetical protein